MCSFIMYEILVCIESCYLQDGVGLVLIGIGLLGILMDSFYGIQEYPEGVHIVKKGCISYLSVVLISIDLFKLLVI